MMHTENLQELLESLPYWDLLGIKLVKLTPGYSELHLPVKKELTQMQGIMHGGAIASLLDAAGAVALFKLIDLTKEKVVTVELKINYLHPVAPAQKGITATSRVLKKGRRIAVSYIEIRDTAGDLIAAGMGTYAMVPRS